jgi:hypothetical protein
MIMLLGPAFATAVAAASKAELSRQFFANDRDDTGADMV